jgi:hypothetical protein
MGRSVVALVLCSSGCAPDPRDRVPDETHPSEQVDVECQDLDGLTFGAAEPWSVVSEDFVAYARWLEDSVYRYDVTGTVGDGVVALTVFDGVLHAGIGDWHFNAGSRFCPELGEACPYEDAPGHGIPLVTYEPAGIGPRFEHVLPEEQIARFRRTGAGLLMAGIDPSDGDPPPQCARDDPTSATHCSDEASRPHERFERGTFYLKGHDTWFETDALAGGLHVFDLAVLDGAIYAAGSSSPDGDESHATIWSSLDNGRTWDEVVLVDEVGMDHPRVTTLVPVGDQVVAFGYARGAAATPLRFVGDADGFQSEPSLLPDVGGSLSAEVFTRTQALVWSTAGDRSAYVVAEVDGAIEARPLETLADQRFVGAHLACVGDLVLLTESAGGYAAYRTRDLRVFERLLEVDDAMAISSIAFWEDSLVLGSDQGLLLRAPGVP